MSNLTQEENSLTLFQIILFILSIVVLGILATDSLVKLPEEASKLLQTVDTIICAIFFVDFLIRFKRAENKKQFMKWGWIDLVASIPNIDLLRWGRMVRVLRVIRILRGIRSFQRILSILFQNKIKGGLASVAISSILLIAFSSTAILLVEDSGESNIKTAEDALWWSFTTITTVGYGDKYPVTSEGRIIAVVLMISGVGLFGALSGIVASGLASKKRTVKVGSFS